MGWINVAYTLHELKRTEEAFDALRPAEKLFPKCETIPYNLACYLAQLGDLERAKVYLETAFKTGKGTDMKARALDDPDLEPLWREIGKL